jgi:protein-L-isoaspartate(D-aspartate) O-methyltransferase
MDFAAARATMIESQVRTNDVSDLMLQTAMRSVAREAFVVPEKRAFAYAEVTCPSPSGRILWKPRDFAKLAQAAKLVSGESVLVIGGAGGYSAAVFAAMGLVVTILDDQSVSLAGVTSQTGDLAQPQGGPFDVIFVDGGVEVVPETWGKALKDGGRLCVIVQTGPMGQAQIGTKSGTAVAFRTVFDAVVPKFAGFERASSFAF